MSVGRVQVAGGIEGVLAEHRLLSGPLEAAPHLPAWSQVVSSSRTGRQATLLVRCAQPLHDPRWSARPVTLEELVLAYLRRPEASALPPAELAAVPEEEAV
jgi:ABC-2 type transport system ATP-binding protein